MYLMLQRLNLFEHQYFAKISLELVFEKNMRAWQDVSFTLCNFRWTKAAIKRIDFQHIYLLANS